MGRTTLLVISIIYALTTSCTKENLENNNNETVRFDTLDYTQVIRTSDNLFGVTNLYSKKSWYDTDTSMQITSVKVLHFTGPETKKTATINLSVAIPIPYPYSYNFLIPFARVYATGECIIIADKGHYLFKAGDMTKVSKTKNDQIYMDTLVMDKIITGQTIKISPEYRINSNSYSYLELESKSFWEVGNPPTNEKVVKAITETLNLFKENTTSFSMKIIDKNNQERTIVSSSEINYGTDKEIRIKASYRSNFVAPEYMLDEELRRFSNWNKSESERLVLLLGH